MTSFVILLAATLGAAAPVGLKERWTIPVFKGTMNFFILDHCLNACVMDLGCSSGSELRTGDIVNTTFD